ncbi:putative membrane protein [Mucilaginibacter lappiensis]|uniref:Protoporphyrinogen IX oxidase n=1 Tax=Mucilaginibacter lappiensis TaxID=354630 RepID=A0ABR6PMH4_9SPHI|nr:CopD family protein [Mucilaginibacter lappiensis]MBB6110958.1 putative membrane protein [Mucilaginibacter lappiensis]SIR59582.1 putative membrane protein [Mucilaginibacter lappiensis]
MYDYVKAVHIIFVVCYMAGLFYSVRLFIYHTEAQEKPEPDRKILSDQFTIMERKLWNIITIPSMILTVAAGITMLIMRPIWLHFGWMHLKLTFVVVLGVYHHMCQNKIKQMANGVFKWTSTQLRLWNELATLLLFAIVFLVVLKSALNWIFGVVGLVALAMILMIAVKIYKRYRRKKQ